MNDIAPFPPVPPFAEAAAAADILTPDARLLMHNLPAGVVVVDAQGIILDANARYGGCLGYTPAELAGRRIAEITHADDVQRDADGLAALLAGERSEYATEKRYVRKDGQLLRGALSATVVRDAHGAVRYCLGVMHVVDDRRRAEEALRTSELRFRTLFEQAPTSLQLFDADGRTLRFNKAWERLWGFEHDEEVKRYILSGYDILNDPRLEKQGVLPLFRRAFAGETVTIPAIRYDPTEIGGDGRPRWVGAIVHPLRDDDGKVREVLLIHHDVTERMEAEAELQQAKEAAEEANRMKSAFLANMSHEIRTPLSAILGFAELLHRDDAAPSLRREYLGIIERNGRALTRIVNDILDLSQVESGAMRIAPEPVAVRELVGEVASLFEIEHKKRGLYLRLSIDAAAPGRVLADPVRMRQVLVNLVGNAVKFTERGGVSIEVRADGARRRLEIAVRDTGPGIPVGREGELFRPFVRFHDGGGQPGTGLGLALSRRIARLLGGDLVLEDNRPDAGACFVFSLPADDMQALPAAQDGHPAKAPARHERFAGLRVLVADDSADNRLLMRCLLEGEGAHVAEAGDGRAALALLERMQVDVVLLDLRMPVLDGLSTVRALRARGSIVPVVAVTANAMKDEEEDCRAAGCDEHVAKPIEAERLFAAIARCMARRGH